MPCSGWVDLRPTQRFVLRFLPPAYFKSPKAPKAPVHVLLFCFLANVSVGVAVFAIFVYYFASNGSPVTSTSRSLLQGQTCVTLNPKKGVVYYSTQHSENAQFASPFMSSQECVDFLESNKVCGDGNRHDVISVWGVTNPNNTQYYSSGHLSFTPTQTQGKSSSFSSFYTSSVSFPKPDITRAAFTGSSSDWYVYEFTKNTDKEAFTLFKSVSVSSFYTDVKASIVYDPTSSAQVFDLSSSTTIDASNSNQISTLGTALVNYNIVDIGVIDDVYYGIQSSINFSAPYGIAIDASNNVYVSDVTLNIVRKIDPITGAVTVLGVNASPSFSSPKGIAVDANGNVYVADDDNALLRKIDASTDVVTDVGATANPPITFIGPKDVAVDSQGIVYVTDNYLSSLFKIAVDGSWLILGTGTILKPYSLCVDLSDNVYVTDQDGTTPVWKIDATTGITTGLGASASPAISPVGIAVDASNNVYASDSSNVYVAVYTNDNIRKIDASTGTVTTISAIASPAFKSSYGVAVDSNGQVYVADQGNKMVRVIDAAGTSVNRFGFLQPPRVFSWDMKHYANNPSNITLWPNTALLSHHPYLNDDITLVDTRSEACTNVASNVGNCYTLAHAEYNVETKRIYLQFDQYYQFGYYYGPKSGDSTFNILDPSSSHTATPSIGTRNANLLAVFQTPLHGDVLFTDQGAVNSSLDVYGRGAAITTYTNYKALIVAAGTSVIEVTKIPNSPPRYLLLQLDQKGFASTYTYDTFTDTIVSSNDKAAATTHFMLAYTWGICDGNITRSLVEITFSNDYSNICRLPSTGMYYQSPNYYHPIPLDCLGIAYDKLLTDCPSIKAKMRKFVNDTCAAAIPKVCKEQYDDNPPFSCTKNAFPTPLTVLSLAASNAATFFGLFSFFTTTFMFWFCYSKYDPTKEDLAFLAPSTKIQGGSFTAELCNSRLCRKVDMVYKETSGGGVASREASAASAGEGEELTMDLCPDVEMKMLHTHVSHRQGEEQQQRTFVSQEANKLLELLLEQRQELQEQQKQLELQKQHQQQQLYQLQQEQQQLLQAQEQRLLQQQQQQLAEQRQHFESTLEQALVCQHQQVKAKADEERGSVNARER